jgi:hypothetical protein
MALFEAGCGGVRRGGAEIVLDPPIEKIAGKLWRNCAG